MKKLALVLTGIIILSFLLGAEDNILNLGKIQFPRPFVHAQQNFGKGIYRVFLTQKEDAMYFKVFNVKNEFLFEEMAITKPYQGKSKNFRFRIKRELLKGNEYFRLQITRPDNIYLAFFLLQQPGGGEADSQKAYPQTEDENKAG
jgi:hypothetical protein